jgi:protein-tyrosine-phosphatase
MAEGWAREWIRVQQQAKRRGSVEIGNTVVASIALDSSAVFHNNDSHQDRKSVKSKAVQVMAQDGVDISTFYPKSMQEILPLTNYSSSSTTTTTNDDDDHYNKPIDVLIVLCSCGDDVKEKLHQQCKSIQVWNVEAPTAAAKIEGEGAFRRVSLEIRDQVHSLMEELHPESQEMD